jgi:hypothetical protein
MPHGAKENQMQIVQTPDEMVRVMDEWFRNFAPSVAPDLLGTHNNGKRQVDYCLENFGAVSITGLTQAYEALKAAGVLDLKPAEPVLSEGEKARLQAEKSEKKMRQDYLDSVKPQLSFEEHQKAEQAKKATEEAKKAQDDAKGQLAVAIAGYQCYRVNGSGVDYTATELMQKELSTVVSRSSNGQRDYVRTLAAVRQIILELPDHPRIGDVARTLESINARSLKPDQSKDSFGSDVKRTGNLGGLR